MNDPGKKKPESKKVKDQGSQTALAPPPKEPASEGPLVFTLPTASEQKSSSQITDDKAAGDAAKARPAGHADRPKSLVERKRQADDLKPALAQRPQPPQAAAAPRRPAGDSRTGAGRRRKPRTNLWLLFGVGLLVAWLALHPKFRAALSPYLTSQPLEVASPDTKVVPEAESPDTEAARLLTALGLEAEGAATALESAVRQFQEMAGLEVDGKVSDSLLDELRAVSGLMEGATGEEP